MSSLWRIKKNNVETEATRNLSISKTKTWASTLKNIGCVAVAAAEYAQNIHIQHMLRLYIIFIRCETRIKVFFLKFLLYEF